MTSSIDATLPIDGIPAVKADLRANLGFAKAEIESLQGGLLELIEHTATVDPGVNDDANDGYIAGRSRWLNTAADRLWYCVDSTVGSAVWAQVGGGGGGGGSGTITSVNGDSGPTVVLDASEINVIGPADNFTPAGAQVEQWLQAIDTKFGTISVGTDAAPTQVTSNATPFALTTSARLHNNVEILSHTSTVDFEVPTDAAAGSKWYIRAKHAGCRVSVNTDPVGSSINGVQGDTARLINGGIAIVEVDTNAGSAPVVLVRGDIIADTVLVGGTKTYNNDDSNQDFRLSTTSTQTFSAVSGYEEGFYVNLFAQGSGSTTIDGLDADYTAVAPDVVTVKKVGASMWAWGKAGLVVLDAA